MFSIVRPLREIEDFFLGINYIIIEEIANLGNPFIAFICESIERTIIIPAQLFLAIFLKSVMLVMVNTKSTLIKI